MSLRTYTGPCIDRHVERVAHRPDPDVDPGRRDDGARLGHLGVDQPLRGRGQDEADVEASEQDLGRSGRRARAGTHHQDVDAAHASDP